MGSAAGTAGVERGDAGVDGAGAEVEGTSKIRHFDFGIRTSYTKLSSTEQKLDRRLDIPMRADALGVFDRPTTPIDRKSKMGLNTLCAGFGRKENEYFVWNAYGGLGVGVDRTHQRFLAAKLDVNFDYGTYYAGMSAELYPWRVPGEAKSSAWVDRLRASRPFLTAGFETGFVRGGGEGKYSIGPRTVYKDSDRVEDWLFSWPVGAGWSIPLSETWSVQLVGDYRLHAYRPEEYNGWNFTTGLRYRF